MSAKKLTAAQRLRQLKALHAKRMQRYRAKLKAKKAQTTEVVK